MSKVPPDVGMLFLQYTRLERKRTREGLNVAELERWSGLKQRLNQRFSPGLEESQAERRESVRVPTKLHCSFESIGSFESAAITNLSSGGVFISTVSPLPIGSKLKLTIQISETGAEIEVPGVVVSNNVGPDLSTNKRGMGVRFSELAPEMLEQIHALYSSAIASQCAPEEPGEAAGAKKAKAGGD